MNGLSVLHGLLSLAITPSLSALVPSGPAVGSHAPDHGLVEFAGEPGEESSARIQALGIDWPVALVGKEETTPHYAPEVDRPQLLRHPAG